MGSPTTENDMRFKDSTLILNIGLNVGTERKHTEESVKAALSAAGLTRFTGRRIPDLAVFDSDTEPTVVVTIGGSLSEPFTKAIHRVSVALEQEAIAVYSPSTQTGAVVGPKAEAWGAFNPSFFIMPDGTRLGA
jgi:hypothetical protein